MIKKLLSIFKFFMSFIVTIGVLIGGIAFGEKINRPDALSDIIGLGVLVILVSIYAFYLIRTAIWNWENKAYRFNILLIAGTIIQCCFGVVLLFRLNYQIRGAYFWTQGSLVLILWIIAVYDAIRVFKALKRMSRKDEELLAELFQDS